MSTFATIVNYEKESYRTVILNSQNEIEAVFASTKCDGIDVYRIYPGDVVINVNCDFMFQQTVKKKVV